MNKEELRKWMNYYHDEWIKSHNKLVDIQRVLEGVEFALTEEEIKMKEETTIKVSDKTIKKIKLSIKELNKECKKAEEIGNKFLEKSRQKNNK